MAVKLYLELKLIVALNELQPGDRDSRKLVSEKLGLTTLAFPPEFWKEIGSAAKALRKKHETFGVVMPRREGGAPGRQIPGRFARARPQVPRRGGGKGKGKGTGSGACFTCGGKGHMAKDCKVKN